MKALKVILIIVLALVLLVGGGVYLLVKNLDGLVASAIESIGSEVTQTQVKVDKVSLKLREGRGEIHGLNIANLAGFEEPNLFHLEQVALQVDPSSLREPVIVLDEILIDGARLTAEHKGLADTNLKKLMDNIQQSLGGGSKQSSSSEGGGAQPRFMVEKLSFTDISMDLVSPEFNNRTLTLADIKRSNLGTREQGLTGEQLARAVVQPLIDSARKRVEQEAKGRLEEEAQKALEKNLSEEDKQTLKKLRALIE